MKVVKDLVHQFSPYLKSVAVIHCENKNYEIYSSYIVHDRTLVHTQVERLLIALLKYAYNHTVYAQSAPPGLHTC